MGYPVPYPPPPPPEEGRHRAGLSLCGCGVLCVCGELVVGGFGVYFGRECVFGIGDFCVGVWRIFEVGFGLGGWGWSEVSRL